MTAPSLSLLVDRGTAPQGALMRSWRSLVAQDDEAWELVVHGPEVPRLASDSRVRFVATPEPDADPADRLNALLQAASGDLIAVLEPGGELAEQAVGTLSGHAENWPEAQVFVSDEVVERYDRPGLDLLRKPAWSPERLRHELYLGRLTALRRPLVDELDGYRTGFDGAHEHDLLLRALEAGAEAARLPELLHRSVGCEPRDDAATVAGHVRAVQEHLDRRGHGARASAGPVPGTVSVSRSVPSGTTVSVVIASDAEFGLAWGERGYFAVRAAESFLRGAGGTAVDVTVVHADDAPGPLLDQLRALGPAVRTLAAGEDFALAKFRNRGVLASTGELVVLADERVEAEGPDFVEQLVAPLLEGEIGLTGPRLLSAGGFHVGAGVAAYKDQAKPVHSNRIDGEEDAPLDLLVSREATALLAHCVALTRDTYRRVGGITERLPYLHTVDLAAKVAFVGLTTVWVRPAVARWFGKHEATDPRRTSPIKSGEKFRFVERWNPPELDRYLPTFGEAEMLRSTLIAIEHDVPETRKKDKAADSVLKARARRRRLARRVRQLDKLV